MKRSIFFIALVFCSCSIREKTIEREVGEVNVIPQPTVITRIGGEFEINQQTVIVATDEACIPAANAINEALSQSYGFSPLTILKTSGPANSIELTAKPQPGGTALRDESYVLNVQPKGVGIIGTETGLFYGAQTLIQMIPADVSAGIRIPAAMITDHPEFRYRGFHLDEARHFLGTDFVKKYIAHAARYKLNYFHWHLTDDQGWRIAIEKYPRLEEIGSRRRESVVAEAYLKRRPFAGDRKPIEGFYTREQIADIAAFAKAHSVIIVPEIEMPGHSSAALAAYPELGCKPDYPYKVQTTWGNPPDGFPDILCPSEDTIAFLSDVLDEVIGMFPDSPYIHIGGDETNLSHWRSSSVVQGIKAREGFKDENQVLKWFIDRIAAHVESRGRKIICWDDMIEKGQYPNATIMSWKGSVVAKLAAIAGREVIITPYEKLYFDHPQSSAAEEARSFGPVVTLKSVYNFSATPPRPLPEESRNIIGGEGCVWTEFIDSPGRAEYMAFPRLIALADGLWHGNNGKDFREFITRRLHNEFARLDRLPNELKINYRIPEPFDLTDRWLGKNEPAARIELLSPVPDGKIYYTTDGSVPSLASTVYLGPFLFEVPPGFERTIKAIIKLPNGQMSTQFEAKYSRVGVDVLRNIQSRSADPLRPKSESKNIEVISRADQYLPPPAPRQARPAANKSAVKSAIDQ